MRNLFSILVVAVLVPVGAQALSAQQAQGTTNAKTTQTPSAKSTQTTTHHTRKHHRRHTSKMVARRARSEHESVATERREVRHARRVRHHEAMRSNMNGMNGMAMNREPEVLGTPAPGFPAPPAVTTLPTRNLPRLSNGLITLDAARRIALQTVPGGTSVTKIQRHTEDGRQVYDVKVITPNQTGNEMVRVDAHTGAVVETKNVDNPVGAVKGAVDKAVNKVKHP